MRYEVGDTVVLKDDIELMGDDEAKYFGCAVKIKKINASNDYFFAEGYWWEWSEVNEEQTKIINQPKGTIKDLFKEDATDINVATKQKAENMREIMNNAIDLYEKKNEAYGNSFGKTFDEYGVISAIIRIDDKFTRLKALTLDGAKNEIKDESINDTLTDLAMYALMTILELKE